MRHAAPQILDADGKRAIAERALELFNRQAAELKVRLCLPHADVRGSQCLCTRVPRLPASPLPLTAPTLAL